MDIEQFESLVDHFGPSIDSWKDDDLRQQAQEFSRDNDHAQFVLEHAETFDRLLDRAAFVPRPIGLKSKILESLPTRQMDALSKGWVRWLWRSAFVALPLVVGFFVGMDAYDEFILVEDEITYLTFEDHSDLVAFTDE